MSLPTRDKIFISYSHSDEVWLEELRKRLEPHLEDGKLSVWADTNIEQGEKWKPQIWAALNTACVAVLLVTQEFIASPFIMREELPQLTQAHGEGKLKLMWVAVSSSTVKRTAIEDYQCLNELEKPLDSLPEHEKRRVLVEIVDKILDVASNHCERRPPPAEERTEHEVTGQQKEVTPTPVTPSPPRELLGCGVAFWLRAAIVLFVVLLLITLGGLYYLQRRGDAPAENQNLAPAVPTPPRNVTLRILRPDKNGLVDPTYTIEWESPYPRTDWHHYILVQRPDRPKGTMQVELSPARPNGESWSGQARFGDQIEDQGKEFGVKVLVTKAVLVMPEIKEDELPADAETTDIVTVKRRGLAPDRAKAESLNSTGRRSPRTAR
jgi:hypothetical protein